MSDADNTVKIPVHDGGALDAYVALPEITPAPAIIVIQEIFGVNQEMRDKCDDLAKQGYVAICPDLFWRLERNVQLVDSDPKQLEIAFQMYQDFDIEMGMEDLRTTLGFVRTMKETADHKIGTIGYCLGGLLAYLFSSDSSIDAAVSYYGVNIVAGLEKAETIDSPLLMHMAEKDEFVPPADQETIKSAFKDHPFITIHAYEGVDHAFARGNGMHYDEAAATLANSRTAEFLSQNLKA